MSDNTSFFPLDLDSGVLCHAVFSHASIPMLIVNEEGRISLANNKCHELFGYEASELIGSTVEKLIPNSRKKAHLELRKEYFHNFKETSLEKGRRLEAIGKDGKIFPVEISLSGLVVENKRYVLTVISDISDKDEIQQKLVDSQHQLASIIESAVDGIITITDKGIIQSVNPSAAKLFGYEEEEMIGNNIRLLMPEPFHSQHDGYLHAYRSTGHRKIIGIGREVIGKRKDGSVFPFYLSVGEVQLKNRRIFTGIVHDLTEQKRAEEKLKRYNEELEKRVDARTKALAQAMEGMENEIRERKEIEEQLIETQKEIVQSLEVERTLNELKSRFVSMASHEFRTPLATILSSVSLIDRYHDPDQVDKRIKHINRIKSNVKNLTQILNDFLSLSKLEEGKVSHRPEWIVLKDLAEELTEALQTQTKDNQRIVYQHEGEAQKIFIDPFMIKNICHNFLSNAIKYSPAGSEISFLTQQHETDILIKVRDQGIGIPEEEQKHLFERFFRAQNATNIQGTGLGLSIVKRYADLLGGEVGWESQEGQGSTFWIRIHLNP